MVRARCPPSRQLGWHSVPERHLPRCSCLSTSVLGRRKVSGSARTSAGLLPRNSARDGHCPADMWPSVLLVIHQCRLKSREPQQVSQSVSQSVILNPQQGSCSSRIRSNGFRWKPYHPPVIICGISKHDLDQTDQKSTSLACGTGPSLLEKHSARARARVCMCVWICMLTPPHLHKNQPIMAVWVNPSVHTAEVERRGRVGRGKDSQEISRGGRPFRWVMLLDPRGQFTTRRGKAGLSSRQNSAEAEKNTRTHTHTHTHKKDIHANICTSHSVVTARPRLRYSVPVMCVVEAWTCSDSCSRVKSVGAQRPSGAHWIGMDGMYSTM